MNVLAFNVYTMYHGSMKTKIMQWGNSLAIRIPKTFAQQIRVESGTEVEVSLHDKALVIAKPHYNLTDMLNSITPENLHKEVEMGKPLGKEVW